MMLWMSVSYLFPSEPDDRRIAALAQATVAAKRNTKAIGDRSELEVALALARRGYLVSKPIADSYRYDLVMDDGDRLFRVQVKTGRLVHGEIIKFACSSMHYHRRSGTNACRPYFGEIDYLAVFVPGLEKVYLVPESELVATQGHLRVAPTRNRQTRNIRWAAEYELV